MRKILLSAACLFTGMVSYAQQDYQFSQYMFDRLSINPAYAGIDNKICATGFFRQQWAGFTGAPSTFLFNAHGPVKMLHGGLGLSLYSDKIGFFNNFSARLNYSFHQPVKGGILGGGISIGFMNVSLNPQWVAITDPSLDNAIPNNGASYSQGSYDIGLGVYYKANDWYAGLSATHLTETDLKNLNVKNVRHYYLMGGYDWTLPSNADFMIRPSMRLESDATSTQVDINANVLWRNMFWGGLSYRIKDAIVPMLGYQQAIGDPKKMPGMIKIGYSYDVTTSEIKNYSKGSHEFMVSYCFNVVPVPTLQKSKTVRFL